MYVIVCYTYNNIHYNIQYHILKFYIPPYIKFIMVNTFLLCSDFKINASMIDNRRLNRQISEAMLMIRGIQTTKFIIEYMSDDEYVQSLDRLYMPMKDYISIVTKEYKNLDLGHTFDDVPGYGIDIKEDDSGEKPISYYHSNHSALRMWFYHEDALKYYTNCCIDEWLYRDYDNNRPYYEVDVENIKYPWWMGHMWTYMDYADKLREKMPKHYFFLPECKDIRRYRWWAEDMENYHMHNVTREKVIGIVPEFV